MNVASGLGVTTSCKDVDGALSFVNDLLDQDIHDLRFWGIPGTDYEIDNDGVFYRTNEQRRSLLSTSYKLSHMCNYAYFPHWNGMSDDGINSNLPTDQPGEYYDGLSDQVKECLSAYGARNYVDMLGTNESPGPWYPMFSYSNSMSNATSGGLAWNLMGQVKQIEVFPDFRYVRVAEPDGLFRQIADLQKMPQTLRDFREVDAVKYV